MKLSSLNDDSLLKEFAALYGHSANRRRYLDRFPSQYFRNKKPKSQKKAKT